MRRRIPWLDKAAISLSGLCLVHCLAGALLLALLSTTGGLLFSHRIHAVGLALAIPLAAFALTRGVAAHRRWGVALLGFTGIAAMTVGLASGHSAETVFTVPGVAMLALAHLWNLRAQA